MSRTKPRVTDPAAKKSQAFDHLSKRQFLAAINGDITVPSWPNSDQGQRKTSSKQGVVKSQVTPESSQQSKSRKATSNPILRSTKTGIFSSTDDFQVLSHHDEQDFHTPSKTQKRKREGNQASTLESFKRQRLQGSKYHNDVAPPQAQDCSFERKTPVEMEPYPSEPILKDGIDPILNPFSQEAIKMRFNAARDQPVTPVLRNPQPLRSTPRAFSSERGMFRSQAPSSIAYPEKDNGYQSRSQTPSLQTRIAMQSDRTHTPVTPGRSASETDGEEAQASELSRSGAQTPSTPGRSPYLQRIARPRSVSALPRQHEERRMFPDRAERTRTERPIEEISGKGGVFTPSEKDRLFEFCATYQQAKNLNDQELATLINQSTCDDAIAKEFYSHVYDLVPYRKKEAVRRFLKRHFHNFNASGKWSEDDDRRLAEAASRLNRKWILVGAELDRHPEHCRDRYRNYHFTKDQKLSKWEDSESDTLRGAVGDYMLKVVREKVKDIKENSATVDPHTGLPSWVVTEEEASKMVLWSTIASHVPKRSRMQCYMRYGTLRRNGATSYVMELRRAIKRAGFDDSVVDGVYVLTQGTPADHPAGIRLNYKPSERSSRYKIKELYGGDMLELLQAIRESKIKRDENIDWDGIRVSRKSLQMFGEGILAPAWESMKSKYEATKGKSLHKVKTRKSAKKIKSFMERTMSEAEKSRHWGLLNRHHLKDKVGKKLGRRNGDHFKTPFFVDEEDREEPNDTETRDFTLGNLNTEITSLSVQINRNNNL